MEMDRTQKVELEKLVLDLKKKMETLVLMGDFHEGNQSYEDRQALLRAIRTIMKHPNWKVLINGDYVDAEQFSSYPTAKTPPSLAQTLQNISKAIDPIKPQIYGVSQGNHEERCFREPVGKGMLPNLLYGHYGFGNDIQQKNPNCVCVPLLRGLHLKLNTLDREIPMVMKHGYRAGKTRHFLEFEDMVGLYPDVEAIFLSHTHRPFHAPRLQVLTDGNTRKLWFVRGGAFTSWLPYQEKKNLPPSPLGFYKLEIKKGILQEPRFVFC